MNITTEDELATTLIRSPHQTTNIKPQ